jgi:beta propeller domain-containing protein
MRATQIADRLIPFASCGDALRNLRATASKVVGPAGFAVSPTQPVAGRSAGPSSNDRSATPAGAPVAASQGAANAGSAPSGQIGAPPSYSGTNTATAGVDEPDLVKTDGRRIVTVIGGILRVVDAQSGQLTGVLDLTSWANAAGGAPVNLLLAGDHALVLFNQSYQAPGLPVPELPASTAGTESIPTSISGPHLLLIDLSATTPRIISAYTIDGALVDARQVGSVVRVVIRSAPRVYFPASYGQSEQEQATADRHAINHAGLNAWLPRYAVTAGGIARTGRVGCADLSHPAVTTYTGTSMLTVLTFDLNGDRLGAGQPLTVIADGDTVYSSGDNLYIANDRQWNMPQNPQVTAVPESSPAQAMPESNPAPVTPAISPSGEAQVPAVVPQQYVGLYKFDISRPGRPVYEASGTVPGWLLGSAGTAQYALSEWDGVLRVATTTGLFGWAGPPPTSAVYVLEQVGAQLVIVGKVGGLGPGDQIYAVRFAGPVGYVVTYRAVDPLYTLDLSDPAQPRVVGEVQLSGYSAYLDPIDASHLVGIGQAANADGQIQGTQVSLFDVSDLAAPVRTAVFRLPYGHSEAEIDPHAFLYWPATGLLVVPVQLPYPQTSPPPSGSTSPPPGSSPPDQASIWPLSAALVLHVGNHAISEAALITQPATPADPAGGQILRALVVGNELWTLSDQGLKANDLTTLAPLAWVPFT